MSQKYPLGYCLRPVNVYVHGEKHRVACGSCDACRQKKSYIYQSRCSLEMSTSYSTHLITLTYSNKNLPYFNYYHPSDDPTRYILCVGTRRLRRELSLDEVIINVDSLDNVIDLINVRSGVNKDIGSETAIPFLYKRDLQNFIKRLRFYVNPNNYEYRKIRYFAIGEYGPQTMRPHFHILVFSPNAEVSKDIFRCVGKAWKYGFVDCQRCTSDASSYVTSYVSSLSTLPTFYKDNGLQPFSCHSQKLGEGIFKRSFRDVYESPLDEFDKVVTDVKSRTEIVPFQSVASYYFPRCRDYSFLSHSERKSRYLIWQKLTLLCLPADFTVMDYAHYIYHCIYLDPSKRVKFPASDWYLTSMEELYNNLEQHIFCHLDSLSKSYHGLSPLEVEKRLINNIYSYLRCSYHFVVDICNFDSNLYDRYLSKIESYYTLKDYQLLTDNLSCIDLFQYSDGFDISLFYDDYYLLDSRVPEFDRSIFYNQLKSKVKLQFDSMTKHKDRNDAMGIFFEENLRQHDNFNTNL